MTSGDKTSKDQQIELKKIPPYWHPYRTMAKGRWVGREILEVVSTEFRDRSLEYYRYALESGVTTLNGVIAKPGTIIQNGDLLENIVHRHEPPVTSIPIKIIHEVPDEYIVIDKPGSIPVHSTGRYHKQSVIEILKNEFKYPKVFRESLVSSQCKTSRRLEKAVNRLDRLTSGMMVMALSSERARLLTDEFMNGTIRKEYIARCKGEFPAETTTCEEPLLTVDRQMGLNIVHPDGKHAKTIFNRLFYDLESDTSVLHCQPLTGRSHQIRVHLQFLGYPIANDPIYSDSKIWGTKVGKGGLDSTPTSERAPPLPPSHLQSTTYPKVVSERLGGEGTLLPRESGEDIGMGSPVPLSSEAVGVITNLRNMKDEEDDWSRWKDVIFRAKAALVPERVKREVRMRPLEPKFKNVRKRGLKQCSQPIVPVMENGGEIGTPKDVSSNPGTPVPDESEVNKTTADSERAVVVHELLNASANNSNTDKEQPGDSTESAHSYNHMGRALGSNTGQQSQTTEPDGNYCPECYLPLFPDPAPEKLYIYLHALRYTTSLGTFDTPMPPWAKEDYVLR